MPPEDAQTPTWHNMIAGQINLRDAVRRSITLDQEGKKYALNDKTAVLMARPRGWHLNEKHVLVDGGVADPVPAGPIPLPPRLSISRPNTPRKMKNPACEAGLFI